jgi:hypothetical protein
MPGSEPLPRALRLAAPALLVAVILPYTVVLGTLLSRTNGEIGTVQQERAGITALRPLVTLLAVTADTQTRAVSGRTPDPARLHDVITQVDSATARVGARLDIDRRWADLRSRLTHLEPTNTQGTQAYALFSPVVDLELQLLTAVGDASGLRTDAEIDSHYLALASLDLVPELLVSGGRISDLTLLLERRLAPVAPDTLAIAVAQSGIQRAATQLDNGLHKGFEATNSRSLGPSLLSALDQLSDAVTTLAPPLSAIGASSVVRPSSTTQAARQQLQTATLAAETAALDRLEELLNDRADRVTLIRQAVIGFTAAGLAVVLAVLWLAGPRRQADTDDTEDEHNAGITLPRTGARLPSGESADDAESLIEARELLEAHQLIRVGRAVAPVREEEPPAEEDS